MLACTQQGDLVLLPKRKVAEQPETLFRIEPSRMKAPLSMLFDLANRPKTYWEDENCFEENKEKGHAMYMPYSSEQEMVSDEAYYDMPWLTCHSEDMCSLSGDWFFHLVPEPS
ncbi:hypothetical protein EVA_14864 [gut metagenome]|uniref:Uncharacterized protein n=1 Tax=gut metagenome TaxID=749906 RepID=J9FQ31_9ZZZZ